MSPDDERHGTYAGYQQHRRAGERACDPCMAASREYTRQHRANRDPQKSAREAARSKARQRALWRLTALHPEEFNRLTVEEMQAEPALQPHSTT